MGCEMSRRCNQTGSPRRSRPHKFHCGNGGALRLPSPTGSTSYWSNQLQARDAKRRSDPGKRTIVTSITVKRAFSMSEGVRFTYWLHAMATLSEATSKTSYVDFVNKVLHDPSTDPRKIMFFFVNSKGRQVIATYGGKSYESLLPKISRYSAQHPANQVMRDTVAEVSDLIKTASR
jgi:hypothetical protein